MRSCSAIAGVVLVFLCSLAAPSRAQQLLTNPGFEGAFASVQYPTCTSITGVVATSWDDNSCWVGNPIVSLSLARETVNPHSGVSCQRIVHGGGGLVQLVQSVPLESGRRYTASVWLRSDTAGSAVVALRDADAPYQFHVSKLVRLTPQWTQVVISGFAETVPGLFMVIAQSRGTVWVDDASLTSVAEPLNFASGVIPREFFGMHFHGAGFAWPAPGFRIGSVRIWDADGVTSQGPAAQWAAINPAPGVYDWAGLDAHVARAEANGASVLFNFARTPQWASARPNEDSPYGPGQAAEPLTLQIWRDWVTAVATRYQGRIRYWEVWNEPNYPLFFTGTPEQLIDLAREAYTILKQIDPTNVVLTPGFVDLGYLDRYLELGGGAYADVVAYHFYTDGEPEGVYRTQIPNAKIILASRGQSAKPLWDTESGWWQPPVYATEVGEAILARTYLMFWAGGLARHYHYAWDSPGPANIELALRPDFTVPTPAGSALGEVTRWMTGARITSVESDTSGTWILGLTMPAGTTAHAVWNTRASSAQPRPFAVPLTWGATRARTLRGVESAIVPGAVVSIEARPLLIAQAPVADVDPRHADGDGSLSADQPTGTGGVRFTFRLAANATASLRVFDIRGACVAELLEGALPKGQHVRTWQPDRAPGVYFARLETSHGRARSVRFTLR